MILVLSCSSGVQFRAEWVHRAPQSQAVLAAYRATLPRLIEQCQPQVDESLPLETTIAGLLEKDSARWLPTRCDALSDICHAGRALSDHGLEQAGNQWQPFCDFAKVCHERRRALEQLDQELARWQPPTLLVLARRWPATETQYGTDLARQEPGIAAAVRRQRQLQVAASSDHCAWSYLYARNFVHTGLALMGPGKRTLTYLAGELARPAPPAEALLNRLTPATKAYATLQRAYAQYRDVAGQGGFYQLPGTCKGLRRSARKDPRHGLLAARLAQEGLSSLPVQREARIPFTGSLEKALKRFQRAHHLLETGTVGPATLAALNQTARSKQEALRSALSAYRRAVPPYESTLVLVQMPAAFAEIYVNGEHRRLEPVVIGRGQKDSDGLLPFATPVLDATITAIIFNPVWHVPSSIAQDEIEPLLVRDPGYLARNHFLRSVVGDQPARYRQLPGPENALGQVKFHFANSHDVYLHDTPRKHLFKKPRRLFSHGCVRMHHATKVAALLLNRDQGFSWDQLKTVLKSGKTVEYRLRTPIPVHLVYSSAAADGEGNLHFLPDLYEREQANGEH
jgi:hypothetical protein